MHPSSCHLSLFLSIFLSACQPIHWLKCLIYFLPLIHLSIGYRYLGSISPFLPVTDGKSLKCKVLNFLPRHLSTLCLPDRLHVPSHLLPFFLSFHVHLCLPRSFRSLPYLHFPSLSLEDSRVMIVVSDLYFWTSDAINKLPFSICWLDWLQ